MKVRRIDFSPDEWIGGTRGLTLEQEGLYIRICALIYSTGRPLPRDRDTLGRLSGLDRRRLDRVLESLISAGKCVEVGETLTVLRCEVELKSAQLRAEVGGKNIAKRWKSNESADTKAVAGANTNHQPSTINHQDSVSEPIGSPTEKVPIGTCRDVADDMLKVWREVCGHIHNPAHIEKDRATKLTTRWRDSFGQDMSRWRACCETVARSPLLSGQKGDWHATLDWVLQPRNLRKILEGVYPPSRLPTADVLPFAAPGFS